MITATYRHGETITLNDDPCIYLDELCQRYYCAETISESPILGGLFGSFSYEFAQYLPDFSNLLTSGTFPDFIGGLYDRLIVINHQTKQHYYIHSTLFDSNLMEFELAAISPPDPFKSSELNHITSKEHYLDAVNTLKKYIYQGDIYQANYSIGFNVDFTGHPFELYQQLRQLSPTSYGAYLHLQQHHILSSSPELFFKSDGHNITTRPIKGTMPRGETAAIDANNKAFLLQSEKDIAELTMITDLKRHDFKKICKAGSIAVPELRCIETYPQVFHGVSTVTGKLLDNVTLSQLLTAVFPGGSITGAPKIRAMELINDIETMARGPFTGAIGYMGMNGVSQFNIAIRTAYSIANQLFFHAGGGIVADSDPENEYNEVLAKSKGIRDALSVKNRALKYKIN